MNNRCRCASQGYLIILSRADLRRRSLCTLPTTSNAVRGVFGASSPPPGNPHLSHPYLAFFDHPPAWQNSHTHEPRVVASSSRYCHWSPCIQLVRPNLSAQCTPRRYGRHASVPVNNVLDAPGPAIVLLSMTKEHTNTPNQRMLHNDYTAALLHIISHQPATFQTTRASVISRRET